MSSSSKSVKLFNLEDRKIATGTITEVDVFQWKNTLLDNLRREPDFVDHCKDSSKWDIERVENRGFQDLVQGDGKGKKKADQVNSMLTKIASYAPKSIVREIMRRSKCLEDIWSIARDWGGIQSNGAKHLEYYKVKMSYMKDGKEESKQEFYYRLRDAMEDTLISRKDNIYDDGERIVEDEDMTPTIKSIVVLDWLDAIGGAPLVEYVHRVYSKELETTTLASLQSRIWKNITALMKEIEQEDEVTSSISKCNIHDEIQCRQSTASRPRGNKNFIGRNRGQTSFNPRSRGRNYSRPLENKRQLGMTCKLCQASGSNNFRSHHISECWLLSESDRNAITKASARARAMFVTGDCDPQDSPNESEEEFEDDYEDQE